MGQVPHGSATTNEAIRRAIQHGKESLRALSRRYALIRRRCASGRGTARSWTDGRDQKEPRSTVLSIVEEAVIVCCSSWYYRTGGV